jgi:hypothetical protein
MSGGQEMTRNLREQEPGRGSLKAEAAGTRSLAQATGCAKRAGLYHIQPEGGDPFTIEAKGRKAWALGRLAEAGLRGCTPRIEPAPRWSAYVHQLRKLGVPIEIVRESHGGKFPGTHGRYILRASVAEWGAND